MMPAKATAALVRMATRTTLDPQAFHIQAKVPGRALAEGQQVELPRKQQGEGNANNGDGPNDGHMFPPGAVQAAQLPEDNLLAGRRVGQERHQGNDGSAHGVDGDPGQDAG